MKPEPTPRGNLVTGRAATARSLWPLARREKAAKKLKERVVLIHAFRGPRRILAGRRRFALGLDLLGRTDVDHGRADFLNQIRKIRQVTGCLGLDRRSNQRSRRDGQRRAKGHGSGQRSG